MDRVRGFRLLGWCLLLLWGLTACGSGGNDSIEKAATETNSMALGALKASERPVFLDMLKRLIATLEAAQISCIDDPSNRDPRFARTRLRQLAPALAREGLDAARFAALARRVGRAEQALSRAAEQALADLSREGSTDGREMVMDGRAFADLPAEIALRVLGRAVGRIGREGPVELGKLESLLAAVLQSGAMRARMRRTLAGAMITVDAGKIAVEEAPPRRIVGGKPRPARSGREEPVKASFTGRR